MSEYKFENVLVEGIKGTILINNFDLLFTADNVTYKWSLSNWIRSEKSKKTPKVRLSFKESSIKLTSEISDYDILLKPVVVADFIDDRERLEEFSSLLSECSTKSRQLPKEQEVTKPSPKPLSVTTPTQESKTPKVVEENYEEAKKAVLDSNEKLLRIYNSLVGSEDGSEGLIPSKDFWEHHKTELKTNISQQKARSNLEGFLSIPPASTLVNSQNVYVYSKQLTDTLLSEDETIRNLYNKLVVEKKFPEENFWKRILQSRYFYNLINEKVPEDKILYEEIKGIPIRKPPKKLDANHILRIADPSSEVITFEDLKKVDRNRKYMEVNKKFGKSFSLDETRGVLVDRFNEHSLNIINECQSVSLNLPSSPGPRSTDEEIEAKAENYRKRKLLDTTIHDLQEKEDQEVDSLCVISSLKMPGTQVEPPPSIVKTESTESANKIQLKLHHSTSFPDRSRWISELRDFDIVKYIKDSKLDLKVSKKMFVVNTKLCQSEKLISSPQCTKIYKTNNKLIYNFIVEFDPNTVKLMTEIHQELMEVLQMYYKTLMPEEEKRSNLLSILRMIKHRIESMNDVGISSKTVKALQSGMLDQITAAESYDLKLRSYVAKLRSQRNK
ncbi:uncharacterized protein TA10435 [Theileria annulata]|uniref:BSD domain-containing protein n=1 Tax=Theileria annulata TaxID=5874 RepID=Q4U8Y9_THEAN|nr:uncharacterized protein TA10435 [Theileria annulata]CAI76714.1 hypothetical protein TA10435 [Theileria annulata]|eukprot:XP_953339.1 hypothetical protein TA10435 [Theileria annulata]